MCGSCQVNELSANNALQTFHTRSFADILVIIIGIFCTRSLDFVCNCYSRSILLLKVIQDQQALRVVVKDNSFGKFLFHLTFWRRVIFLHILVSHHFFAESPFNAKFCSTSLFCQESFFAFFSISQIQLQWIMQQQNHHLHHKPS